MQRGKPITKATAAKSTTTTENKPMKFILSFIALSSILSASTCYKLSLGNAALTPAILCNQNNTFTTNTIKCTSPSLQLPTETTIKCNLPTVTPTPITVNSKCTPAPIECPKPVTPVIEPGNPGCKTPTPTGPNCATPEPASYALVGAGLVTAGIARRLRAPKSN